MFSRDRVSKLIASVYGSNSAFALVANISENTVTNWTLGKTEPKVNDVVKIAGLLKTTVAYLVGEIDDPSPGILSALNNYKSEARQIAASPFRGKVDYRTAEGMSREEIEAALEKTNRSLERLELEEARERLLAMLRTS